MTAPARAIETGLCFRSTSRTHVGNVRALNEDRLLERPDIGLWAIADGMGGHEHGDKAAEHVIRALADVEPGDSSYALLADVTSAITRANAALFVDSASARSGSTIVALLAREGHYGCLWVGDSRAYLLRDGLLTRLTRDHSVVQELIDAGTLPEEARKHHPRANVITRAVGVARRIEVDRVFAPILAGDFFLLCSDGLTACLDDQEIAAIVGQSMLNGADELMTAALARGAKDNVSLILLQADASSY